MSVMTASPSITQSTVSAEGVSQSCLAPARKTWGKVPFRGLPASPYQSLLRADLLQSPAVTSTSPPWGGDNSLELHHPGQLALRSQTFLPALAAVPAGSAHLPLPLRATACAVLGWRHGAAPTSSIPCHQSTAAHHQPSPGPVLSTDPVPEPLPPDTARATAAEGERDGESGGRALGPGLRHGLISDKGYGYLSIVNGYSIKLTGGQRFPLDFESPQGRETKLQPPTLTLLERKTKHKRDRCNLAACDGWSEMGRRGGRGRGYGEFWVAFGDVCAAWPFLLQHTRYSRAIASPCAQGRAWPGRKHCWAGRESPTTVDARRERCRASLSQLKRLKPLKGF